MKTVIFTYRGKHEKQKKMESEKHEKAIKFEAKKENEKRSKKKELLGGAMHLALLSANHARGARCIWRCYQGTEPDPPTRVLIILF